MIDETLQVLAGDAPFDCKTSARALLTKLHTCRCFQRDSSSPFFEITAFVRVTTVIVEYNQSLFVRVTEVEAVSPKRRADIILRHKYAILSIRQLRLYSSALEIIVVALHEHDFNVLLFLWKREYVLYDCRR